MNKIKKLLASLTAFVMAVGLIVGGSVPVMADDLPEGTENSTKTITIISPEKLGTSASITYTVYKVFNATSDGTSNNVSYSLPAGSNLTLPLEADDKLSRFTQDTSGNIHYESRDSASGNYTENTTATQLSDSMIQKLSSMKDDFSNVGTVTITGGNTKKTVTVPDYGYYFVTTTTGTVVNITTTNPYTSITDKNTVPTNTKTIVSADSIARGNKNAIASVGSIVKFQSVITIGKGAKGYVYHDTMGTGLKYNNDVTIYKNQATEENKITNPDSGTSYYTISNPSGQTFAVSFSDDYIKNLSELDSLIVVYTATVTDSTLQTQKDTGKNTAYLAYGDNSSYETTSDSTYVYNAKISVTKKANSETGTNLGGAGFILQRTSDSKYYKYTAASGSDSAKIDWVDDENNATQYYSHNADGKLHATTEESDNVETPFEGLSNGEYKLIEKTIPSGYNKADDKTFTINSATNDGWNNDKNLSQSTIVVNKAGSVLPSTGGIGTTIFYIAGGAIIIAAVVMLVSRRKRNA